ncbi:MAG: transmembrane 220 family protein [Balneolaceae bacterium]|nr:transmembrane 220 family protein [Balneolaceae bacterium]
MIRYINYFFTVLFIFSAVVQYNDPDPIRWITIYMAAALFCILFSLQRLTWKPAAILSAVALFWAIFTIPELSVSGFRHMLSDVHMMEQGTEAAREFLGLLIVTGWIGVLAILLRKKENDGENNE